MDLIDKKLAILLATYNGEKYLPQLLDSLMSQTYSAFTIFVHDDGSQDGTQTILKDFADKYSGKIHILEGEATGSAKANFMWMLKKVEGFDFYMLCDQDDVWLPDKVEKTVRAYENETPIEASDAAGIQGSEDARKEIPACVFTDMYVVDESLNKLSDSFITYIGRSGSNTAYTQLLIDNPAAGCTMLINKALRDKVISAVEDASVDLNKIEMHDCLLMVLASIYGKVIFLNEPLVYYRQTGFNEKGAVTESKLQKIARNLGDLFNGSTKAKKKEFISQARMFGTELLKLEDLPAEVKCVLQDFSEIESKGKLSRMKFYKDNNFTRASGNVWMRLWV